MAFAQKVGNRRAEMVACVTNCRGLYELGVFEEATKNIELGLEIAENLGAERFKAFLSIFLAQIQWATQGPGQDIDALMDRTAEISRKSSSGFLGPWVLGTLALVSSDPDRSRKAQHDAEVILAGDCVGPNYLAFYELAMEVCLRLEDWNELDRYADALEAYWRTEPLPRADFYIARGRALLQYGRRALDDATMGTLRRLREEATQVGLQSALPALKPVLREAEP